MLYMLFTLYTIRSIHKFSTLLLNEANLIKMSNLSISINAQYFRMAASDNREAAAHALQFLHCAKIVTNLQQKQTREAAPVELRE